MNLKRMGLLVFPLNRNTVEIIYKARFIYAIDEDISELKGLVKCFVYALFLYDTRENNIQMLYFRNVD